MVMDPKPPPPVPPTIGFLRDQNRVSEVAINCSKCAKMVRVPIADFRLPDDTLFPSLKQYWRRSCGRCGGREISINPVFPPAGGQGVARNPC